jgi:hypothetical protein
MGCISITPLSIDLNAGARGVEELRRVVEEVFQKT